MAVKKVPEALHDLGNLYEERNKLYKDNYKHFGAMMIGLFPKGLILETADDFTRIGLFIHLASKLTRYARQVTEGGHADSLDDIAVYSQMLAEVDNEIRARRRVDPTPSDTIE